MCVCMCMCVCVCVCVCARVCVHTIYLYLYNEPLNTCKVGMLDEGRREVVCMRVHGIEKGMG